MENIPKVPYDNRSDDMGNIHCQGAEDKVVPHRSLQDYFVHTVAGSFSIPRRIHLLKNNPHNKSINLSVLCTVFLAEWRYCCLLVPYNCYIWLSVFFL